jgi:hypothetical protein
MAVRLLSAWEKREWGWAVQWQSRWSVGLSVSQFVMVSSHYWGSWICAEYCRHWSGALSDDSGDLSFVWNHTNVYRVTTNLRSAFLHVFRNWKSGCVLNSMLFFSSKISRISFSSESDLTRRAVHFTNSEMYSFASTFPLQILFWKWRASSSRGRLKF